tara:strand:- start:777 stop:1118 length:342 start_codon:yes stop_codon:yes gene_type:complete
MKEKTATELQEFLMEEFEIDIDTDTLKGFDDEDELECYIQDECLLDVEVIYYAKAINILAENDASLNECLSIASEHGYTLDNLNSETLASLLMTEHNRAHYHDMSSKIEEFFN